MFHYQGLQDVGCGVMRHGEHVIIGKERTIMAFSVIQPTESRKVSRILGSRRTKTLGTFETAIADAN